MYCSKCGTQSSESDVFCRKCGQSLNQMPPSPSPIATQTLAPPVTVVVQGVSERRTSGLAVASLVLGILGIWILAIIFGGVAINQTGKNPNLSGRGMAIAGLILGIVGFFITLFVIIAIVGAAATIF
jgi:Domain of unknown function (DUF4190)/zinc-ribbon domain